MCRSRKAANGIGSFPRAGLWSGSTIRTRRTTSPLRADWKFIATSCSARNSTATPSLANRSTTSCIAKCSCAAASRSAALGRRMKQAANFSLPRTTGFGRCRCAPVPMARCGLWICIARSSNTRAGYHPIVSPNSMCARVMTRAASIAFVGRTIRRALSKMWRSFLRRISPPRSIHRTAPSATLFTVSC